MEEINYLMTIACSPQTYKCLGIDNINTYDITLLSHHQLIRDLCTTPSQALGLPSLTWPLKMLC